jgi:uncharacterized repeat protein (TIGR02543 family)
MKMKNSSLAKILFLCLLLAAGLVALSGTRATAAQVALATDALATDAPFAAGDLLDPSIPPLSAGAPATAKPASTARVAAPLTGTRFQDAPAAPVITVWYGAAQTFGLNGDPQKWVNILGNVSSAAPLASLTYSLNGGPAQPLTVGANGSRLAQAGDFNIELDYTDLLAGNNTVVITATDQSAGVSNANVTVSYQGGGLTWPAGTYVTNWSTATKVNDVAQVVDGQWVIDAGKARPTVFDFDRLVAIGDISWRDYTVTVPITVHSINTNKSPGIGLLVRWQGHYDAENGVRPYVGWRRLGAMAWYRYEKGTPPTEGLQLLGHRGLELGTKPFTLTPGTTYMYKVNITSSPNPSKPATYRFKVWDATQSEPAAWDIEKEGIAGEPRNGSIVLVAHYADASFGNVTVELASTEPKPELNVGTSGTGTGTVGVNPQKATYRFGEDVALTATPSGTSTFEGWVGDIGGTANPATVEMFADRSVNAVFVDPNVVTPISDDFNDCELNDQTWTFINPLGDATLTMTGGQAKITVPAGTGHDIWSGGRNAPRIMQYANDGNFEFDVKFDSAMGQKNQSQGVLVEQDDMKFLRFNYLHDGSTYRIQAFTFVNGEPEPAKANVAITTAAPMYLRVKRVLTGDVWNVFYSANGTDWTLAAGFQFDMTVNSYGVFAGNSSQNPAHEGLIDYFFNKNSPIVPEDPDRRLNLIISGNGTVTREPQKENYACNEPVTLTAVPAAGFKFGGWSGDLSGTETTKQLVMNATKNVTASFVTDVQYTVNASANGAGTVTKNPDKASYSAGEQVTITATPTLGNVFTNWSGDFTNSTNPLVITVNSNINVVGNFVAAPPRTLTVTVNGPGTVTKNPDKATYLHGETVALTATPTGTASFTGWGGAATGTATQVMVLMDGDKTVTANFAENIYTLTTLVEPPGTGSVTVSPQKAAYYEGEVVTVTAVPAAGFNFTGWSGDATGANLSTQVTMTKNSTVTANFVTGETFSVNVNIVGSGSVTKDPNKTEYGYNETVMLQATPGPGYEFVSWSGDATGNENPKTITVTSDMEITATFAEEGIYSLTIIPPVNGTIAVDPVRDLYSPNEQVTLTAVGNTGYVFAAWGNDGAGSTTNPLVITMDGNKTISASFITAPLHTVNVTTNGPGTVVVDPPGTQFYAGTTITLTATAETGYAFMGWSGDVVSNNNPYHLYIDGDKNIVANFGEASEVVSDDFDGCAPLNPMWTWDDALGLADYGANGRQATITVPPGGNYETSRRFHKAAQLMQPAGNTDFAVMVKVESQLSQQYQFQGIVIRQDAYNLVRVEMSYDLGGLRFSTLSFQDGTGKLRKTAQISQTDSDAYLLVRRMGDKFLMYYRDQEADKWMGMGTFNYPSLNVTEVGFFAASYGETGTPAPGHTAVFDYFFNESLPITPEDANAPGLTVNVVGQGSVTRNPAVETYTCGQVISLNATPAQGWRFQNWSGDLNGTTPSLPLTISKKHTVTATFVPVSTTGYKLYLPATIR